ncbi:class I glutamine amidotransferase-like protein [Trametes gibbosa]|nr:class I glutamine amidotransferase-like protein [Trametes gibbosa]
MSSASESKPYKIAVLLCDTPLPAVRAMNGDYGVIFETLFRNSLESVSDPDANFVVDAYDVRNELVYPKDVDEYDAVLLTGSAASAYENLEWINRLVDYVRFLADEKPYIRILGICFGHQIVARALGGECVPNGQWEIGVTKIELTAVGEKLFGVPTLNLEQMHRDHVPSVPPSFHLLGSTPVAPNQGMVRLYPFAPSPSALSPADVHIFTVQGHPEFRTQISREIVKVRHASGLLDNCLVADYERRADWRNDGPGVVGRTLWEMVRAGREQRTRNL